VLPKETAELLIQKLEEEYKWKYQFIISSLLAL
jgi:hypothetical protein